MNYGVIVANDVDSLLMKTAAQPRAATRASTAMSLAEIQAAIPHRAPFLLIDEIVERDERRIVCRKTFRGDEYFYAGHYPELSAHAGRAAVRGGHAGRRGAAVASRRRRRTRRACRSPRG